MVLDAGKIVSDPPYFLFPLFLTNPMQVEFGKPSELLQKDDGVLRSLVDESGDKATLYAMAAKAEAQSSS